MLDAELKRVEKADVIEKVENATKCVCPIVITPKRDIEEIRMCVDMVEQLNGLGMLYQS